MRDRKRKTKASEKAERKNPGAAAAKEQEE